MIESFINYWNNPGVGLDWMILLFFPIIRRSEEVTLVFPDRALDPIIDWLEVSACSLLNGGMVERERGDCRKRSSLTMFTFGISLYYLLPYCVVRNYHRQCGNMY